MGGGDSDDERAKKKVKTHSSLGDELAKYEKSRGLKGKKDGKGKKGKDEGDILARMDAFRGKLRGSFLDDADDEKPEELGDHENADDGETKGPDEENGMEVDDDTGFLSHKLAFPKDDGEETRKAERDYEVIDPRKRGAVAREEEKKRKEKSRRPDGGRGSRR